MIKTITGAKDKLQRLKDSGFPYCLIAVDGNTIGPALIEDILGSMRFCRAPRGIIKQFIFHGYEYVVDEGINISPMTKDEFVEHYMPKPQRSWTHDLSSHNICKISEEAARVKAERERLAANVLRNKETVKAISDRMAHVETATDRIRREVPLQPDCHDNPDKTLKQKTTGVFSQIKRWFKGDVAYKK